MEVTEEITAALDRACGHGLCLGRDAILDAAGRLIPDTDAWFAQKNGTELRLWALNNETLHELAAPCQTPAPPDLDQPRTVKCVYRVQHLNGQETVKCEIERTERPHWPTKTQTAWEFDHGGKRIVEIGYSDADPDAESAEEFATKLVAAIAGAFG